MLYNIKIVMIYNKNNFNNKKIIIIIYKQIWINNRMKINLNKDRIINLMRKFIMKK